MSQKHEMIAERSNPAGSDAGSTSTMALTDSADVTDIIGTAMLLYHGFNPNAR